MELHFYKNSDRMECNPSTQRWGDYSSTILDPNGSDLWTIQEYIPADPGAGTWWAVPCSENTCPATIIVSTPVSTPNIKFEAADRIFASSVVNQPNGYVKFDAEKLVKLLPGFRTTFTSGYMQAYGCGGLKIDSNGNIFRTEPVIEKSTITLPEEEIRSPDVIVYPNPANNILFIAIPYKDERIISIQVYDATLKSISTKYQLGDQPQIDISKFPNGMYFLKVKTKLKIYDAKFIKL